MTIYKNPYVGTDRFPLAPDVPVPSDDAAKPLAYLAQCPNHTQTPLHNAQALANDLGIGALHVKDERSRMGLGSFKALGAAYVIAHDAMILGGDPKTALKGETYVTASAGNHGLSVAAGAHVFGAQAVVFLSETVPETFAQRLRSQKAQVVRHGATYEDSMQGALNAAQENGWALLSDSSWDGYYTRPHRLMEGYLVLMAEAVEQIPSPPTHIFLQAGVGGLAGACAAYARKAWDNTPQIIVVEPVMAPALISSIEAGAFSAASGGASSMGRLDCKEPSLIALRGLSRDANQFVTITESEGETAMPRLAYHGLDTTPSGGAGLAAVMALGEQLGLDHTSHVLCILSEGPE